MGDLQTVGIEHSKACRQAWPWGRSLLRGVASGVVLSFAAWLAGWVSPSRRGRGVGLLWAVVVAGLTGAGGCIDLRKEKKKKSLLIYKKISLLVVITSCSSIFFFFFFSEINFLKLLIKIIFIKKINVNVIQR